MSAAAHPDDPEPLPDGCTRLADGRIALPRFAVFKECSFVRNGQTYHADRNDLEETAANLNHAVRTTGDEVPIVVGHTADLTPEHEQPGIVGYARDFTVEPLFDTGHFAIWATPLALPGHVETFRRHPRRSSEYWFRDHDIDPISLLGASTPRQDLGLHRFSKSGDDPSSPSHVCIIEEEHAMPDDTKDTKPDAPEGGKLDLTPEQLDQIGAALLETKPFKELFAHIDALLGGGGEPEPEPMPGAGDHDDDLSDLLGPGGHDDYDDTPPPAKDGRDKPERMGTNCGSPAGPTSRAPERMSRAAARARESADRVRFARMESDLAEARTQIAQLREDKAAAEVQAELTELAAEGWQFDPERELPRLVKMSREARDERYADIRSYHKRRAAGDGRDAVPQHQQRPVRFSRGLQAGPDAPVAETREEAHDVAVEVARRLSAGEKVTPQQVLAERRGVGNGQVTSVR